MKRRELRIALTAAARVAREREFIIIGSQAVHAHCRRPPAEVLLSQECDLYPKTHPQAASLLEHELGRNSAFARRHGFYVDAVAPEIASLPEGWERRLTTFKVGRVTAFCLEIHDLLVSKLAAGRLKDLELTGAILRLRMARLQVLRRRTATLAPASARKRALSSLSAVVGEMRQR